MEIKTGYFAQKKKYEESGYTVIGITRCPPKWFDGLNMIMLAPQYNLVKSLKDGIINEEIFEQEYLKYLNSIYNYPKDAINSLSLNFDKIVLCCFEKSDSFCHRHILSKYLNENFGFDITEFCIGG